MTFERVVNQQNDLFKIFYKFSQHIFPLEPSVYCVTSGKSLVIRLIKSRIKIIKMINNEFKNKLYIFYVCLVFIIIFIY